MKTTAWFCSYTPEEILVAAGCKSLRLLDVGSPKGAEAYLPVGFCPYIKSLFTTLLEDHKKFSAVVFPNSCDQCRRLGDLANIYFKDKFKIFRIDVPRKKTAAAHEFFIEELNLFKRNFEEKFNIRISDEELLFAIKQANKVRNKILELRDLYYRCQLDIPILDLIEIFSNTTMSNSEKVLKNLEKIIDKKALAEPKELPGPTVGLIASCIPKSINNIIKLIEDHGAQLVFDDICIGSRHFEGLVDETLPPIEGLAQRYLEKANCPRTEISRVEFITKKIVDKKIDGLLFFGMKFCDGAAWDYVGAKPTLDRLGVPNIRIEAELGGVDHELLRTRIGAFIEMLESQNVSVKQEIMNWKK